MAQLRACGWSLLCVLSISHPVCAQDEHRIWGRVITTSGDVHEGFIRWDRNEGSWVDILNASKSVPEVNYQAWLAATGGERAVRSIELGGYLISWNEEDPDFPSTTASGIRFGHLASLTVLGPDRIEVELRSGETVELSGGSTDIGRSIREIIIDEPGGDEVELRWRDLDRVVFSAPPPGARASSPRLFGTVEDTSGRTFTGYVSWDLDEILESDVLDGEEIASGDERDVRFADISAIERIDGGARVTLKTGGTLELTGSNDVDDGHRGVQLSDPELGMVEVEWPEFKALHFHDPDGVTGYDTFDGGRPLRGTVTTQSGEVISGMIRWDADLAATWEFLNGRAGNVSFNIELAYVDRIERGETFGATVTLLDGRSFRLDDAIDVDWPLRVRDAWERGDLQNDRMDSRRLIAALSKVQSFRGILVSEEGANPASASSWRVISWDEFREIRFLHETTVDGRDQGS